MDESLWAYDLLESSIDMDKFLDVFLTDLFPDLGDRDIHFAGESFGGQYVPAYVAMTRRRFDSVILVDPYVEPIRHSLGVYEHFCPLTRDKEEQTKGSGPPRYLNETACAAMEEDYSKCEKLQAPCSSSYDADICVLAGPDCLRLTRWFEDEIRPGGRDPYDDRNTCYEMPLCSDVGMFRPWASLRRAKTY